MTNTIPFTAPSYNKTAFNCPFCNAFAKQNWQNFYYGTSRFSNSNLELDDLKMSICFNCNRYALWHEEIMIYPDISAVEPPNSDLPDVVKVGYQEAANIFRRSPKGAAAILRLAIQKMCIHLGEPGKNLNIDIGNLVKKGLPEKVQKALDVVRVTGNYAVHPGVIEDKDDENVVLQLFRLINFVSEKMISEPRYIDELYSKLPIEKRGQISGRDGKPDLTEGEES